MKLFPALLLLFISTTAFGESKPDSLRNELKKNNNDTVRILLLADLAWELYETDVDESMKHATEAIRLSEKIKREKELSKLWNVVAVCYYMKSDFENSLKSFLKALAYAEKLKKETTDLTNNIGNIYWAMNNFQLANEYYCKALEGYRKAGRERDMGLAWGNLANVNREMKKYEIAICYIDSAISASQKANDRSMLGAQFNNKANILMQMNDTANAIIFYEWALTEKQASGNIIGIANTAFNLGSLYWNTGNLKKAEYYTKMAMDTAIRHGYMETIAGCYNNMAFIEREKGDYKKAFEYYNLFYILHDSIYNDELNSRMTEMKTVYETEKKEQTILKQNAELGKQKAENEARKLQQEQERLFLAGAGIVILLLGILAVFIFRSYRQKKKANILLQQQKSEIIQQKEEITCQRDEIEAQRDKITLQRDQITHINQELTSSIHYAKRIQTAMLRTEEILKSEIKDYFIVFKPRDIVSGDFYWCAKVEEQVIVAVADCTGHGVPGAFMSMLGMSLLKEIVVKEYITQPDVILKRLRKEIVTVLGQSNVSAEEMAMRDGMDISLCTIHTGSKKLQWAGANNPLYIVTGCSSLVTGELNQQPEASNQQLTELKPDKMPVAIYEKMDRFTLHEIQLQSGDRLFMMSDGFADQFGGQHGKKLLSKNVKQLLLKTSELDIISQHKAIEDSIHDWMNPIPAVYEQVDDITILGIKL